jgi:YggT family protein
MYQVIRLVSAVFDAYIFLIVVRCILSWFPVRRSNAALNFVFEATEPVLGFFRSVLRRYVGGPVDFSPMLALAAIYLVRSLVLRLLYMLF